MSPPILLLSWRPNEADGFSSPAYRTGKVGKPVPDTVFLVGGGAVLAVLFALVALWVRR